MVLKGEDPRLKKKGKGIIDNLKSFANIVSKAEPLISSSSKVISSVADAGSKVINTIDKTHDLLKKREEMKKKKLKPIEDSPDWVNDFVKRQNEKGAGFKIIT